MTAEEYSYTGGAPVFSDSKGETLRYILDCLKKACSPFKKAASQSNLNLPLNENKFTQIFVEQVEAFVKPHPNIGIKNQYSDTFHGTKGIPDFYFHKVEEGVHHEPLFIGEAKILPSPGGKSREKEYVVGANHNGGIERFKLEKHGMGISECGLIGFIQKKSHKHWIKEINTWIKDLAKTHKHWKEDEILKAIILEKDYSFIKSMAHRKSDRVNLSHVWITLS